MQIYRLRFKDDNFKSYLQAELQYILLQLSLLGLNRKKVISSSLFIWSSIILQEFGSPFTELTLDWMLTDAPNFSIVKIIKASLFFNLNKLDESIQIYDEILKENSNNLLAQVGMTLSYQQLGCQLKAEQFKKQALQLNSNAFNREFQNDFLIQQLEQEFEFDEPHYIAGYSYNKDYEKQNY